MPKEIDRVIPIKRRISWIVPDNTEDIIKMGKHLGIIDEISEKLM